MGNVDGRDWTPLSTAKPFNLIKKHLTDTERPLFSFCLSAIAWFLSGLPGRVLSVSLGFLDPVDNGQRQEGFGTQRMGTCEIWATQSRVFSMQSLVCGALTQNFKCRSCFWNKMTHATLKISNWL